MTPDDIAALLALLDEPDHPVADARLYRDAASAIRALVEVRAGDLATFIRITDELRADLAGARKMEEHWKLLHRGSQDDRDAALHHIDKLSQERDKLWALARELAGALDEVTTHDLLDRNCCRKHAALALAREAGLLP